MGCHNCYLTLTCGESGEASARTARRTTKGRFGSTADHHLSCGNRQQWVDSGPSPRPIGAAGLAPYADYSQNFGIKPDPALFQATITLRPDWP
jgi:hypothetical protein